MIYLDNNATTFMPDIVKQTIYNYMDQGNPSADYAIAKKSKAIIEETKQLISELCNAPQDKYMIIFNSGASEGNNFIFHSMAESQQQPHFMVSAIEHKTSLECCKSLSSRGLITYELINPELDGTINLKYINPRTSLISVMQANNETGSINKIAHITKQVKQYNSNIVVHCDCVQMFGKHPLDMLASGVDMITISFHKLYGPPQTGCIVISKDVLYKYKLCSMIAGSQNNGWRGGTENVFLIAGCNAAMRYNFADRRNKNIHLAQLRARLLYQLSKYHISWFHDNKPLHNGINIVVFGSKNNCLPNTLLISIVSVTNKINAMCNIKLKKLLYSQGIIISLGSACNTGAASYVLESMNVKKEISQGVIRISTADYTTTQDIDIFVNILCNIIDEELGSNRHS